ncbi:MAG TPA: hypothetical protein PLY70_11805, partial [Saprospiraceae bacterium]|nr:hypothetical protein [Saprospiraceae bacterium]
MGKRILLFVFLLCGSFAQKSLLAQVSVSGSISITSGMGNVTGSGNSFNIEIIGCDPVTFDFNGTASYSGAFLHGIQLSSTNGSPDVNDPFFTFGSGAGICNPNSAPPGWYYSNPSSPSGYDGPGTCAAGLWPANPALSPFDKIGTQTLAYDVSFSVSDASGNCGDVVSIDIIMTDDAQTGAGIGDVGGGSEVVTITFSSSTPVIVDNSPGYTLACGDPLTSIPIPPSIMGCAGETATLVNEINSPSCLGYTITRTWEYTNSCGVTSAQLVQNIDVSSTPNPTWDFSPSDITLDCGDPIPPAFGNISYTNGLSGACEISGSVAPVITGAIDPCLG